jgi:hypothetical protein
MEFAHANCEMRCRTFKNTHFYVLLVCIWVQCGFISIGSAAIFYIICLLIFHNGYDTAHKGGFYKVH